MSDYEDNEEDYLIVVDEVEYPNYLEGYPTSEVVLQDEMEHFDRILPKHFNDIPDRRELIFQRVGAKNANRFYRGVILKKTDNKTFIMRNDTYFKIWPFEHNDTWVIYAKNDARFKEEQIKKDNLWKLYKAGKVFINEDDM